MGAPWTRTRPRRSRAGHRQQWQFRALREAADVLVDDLDVLLVEPLRQRIEQRPRYLHAARLRQADVALASRVAIPDRDLALAAGVLREQRLELRRVGLAVDAQAQQPRVRGTHLGEIHELVGGDAQASRELVGE